MAYHGMVGICCGVMRVFGSTRSTAWYGVNRKAFSGT